MTCPVIDHEFVVDPKPNSIVGGSENGVCLRCRWFEIARPAHRIWLELWQFFVRHWHVIPIEVDIGGLAGELIGLELAPDVEVG